MERDFVDSERAHGRPKDDENESAKESDTHALNSKVGNEALGKTLGAVGVSRAGKSQGAGPLDPGIAEEIKGARGGGAPLSDNVAADMGHHLGSDFSGVRVHTDSKADALSRSVQAEAFTTGSDIFFKGGAYSPDGGDGRRLLAHELTHVVQQSEGSTGNEGQVSHPDDAHEVEARNVGDAVAGASVAAPAPGGVSREAADSSAPVARQEEEEEQMQMSLDREEMPEEELMMSVDREEMPEEELMMSLDRQEEEEEEMQM